MRDVVDCLVAGYRPYKLGLIPDIKNKHTKAMKTEQKQVTGHGVRVNKIPFEKSENKWEKKNPRLTSG